jgi:N-acetylmuramoyl-L-alanine amidase
MIHVIEAGECVMSVAFDNGHFWETLWNHPENEALRKLRAKPTVVSEGDEVFVPELRPKTEKVRTGASYKYKRKGVPAKLSIRLADAEGKPRANLPFTLIIDGKSIKGTSDGKGMVSCALMPNAGSGSLVIGEGKDAETYELRLRHLDPPETESGVRARLTNLRFLADDPEDTRGDDERLAAAISAFQAANQLDVSGSVDDATRKKLVEVHGS